MHFEYEITVDQFEASQLLYHKLCGGRNHVERAIPWILSGIILVAIACSEWSLNWTPILLALIGTWWICSAVIRFFWRGISAVRIPTVTWPRKNSRPT